MNAHHKRLLLTGKLILAVVLLGWVLSKVHWRDRVVDAQGRAWAVLEQLPPAGGPPAVRVRGGWPGSSDIRVRPLSEFVPAPGSAEIIRPGLASTLRTLSPALLAASVGLYSLSLVVLAARWLVLLNVQQVHLGMWEALRLTLLGQLFNALIPGTVGGDLAKAYYVTRITHRRIAALLSILMDRLLGLTELALLAAVMVVIAAAAGLAGWQQLRLPAVLTAVAVAAVTAGLAVVLSGRLRRLLLLQRLLARLPIARQLEPVGQAAGAFARRPGQLALAVLMTTVAHVMWIGSLWLVGLAMDLPIPWYQYFLYIPLIYIIGAVPLTPGGVGLVERFYLLFFVSAVVTPSMVVALALLARLIPIVCGLPGALVVISGPRLPTKEAMQEELGVARP